VHIPALWADEKEIFALADVLREMGTGIIQSGGGREAEMKDGLMARLSEATGRPVVYNNLGQSVRRPGDWKTHGPGRRNLARASAPTLAPEPTTQTFTWQHPGLPRADWHPIPTSSEK
jgi:hypothetical protein